MYRLLAPQIQRRLFDFIFIGYGIEPARTERTATQKPLHRQHNAAPHAVAFDRLVRILRARRMKPAHAAKKRREKGLVETHKRECDPHAKVAGFPGQSAVFVGAVARGSNLRNSSASAEKSAAAAELRG